LQGRVRRNLVQEHVSLRVIAVKPHRRHAPQYHLAQSARPVASHMWKKFSPRS